MSKSTPKINGPTWLTIARMVLAVVFFIFMFIPNTWARIVALVLFVLGAVTDKIDGTWARSQNMVTDLGAFLDPLADKMLVNLAFLALTVMNIVPVWVFAVILVRDFAVDGMRMMLARKGITVAASFLGKLKTTFQMMALIILLLNLIINVEWLAVIGNVTLYIAVALTVVSGTDYIVKARHKI